MTFSNHSNGEIIKKNTVTTTIKTEPNTQRRGFGNNAAPRWKHPAPSIADYTTVNRILSGDSTQEAFELRLWTNTYRKTTGFEIISELYRGTFSLLELMQYDIQVLRNNQWIRIFNFIYAWIHTDIQGTSEQSIVSLQLSDESPSGRPSIKTSFDAKVRSLHILSL